MAHICYIQVLDLLLDFFDVLVDHILTYPSVILRRYRTEIFHIFLHLFCSMLMRQSSQVANVVGAVLAIVAIWESRNEEDGRSLAHPGKFAHLLGIEFLSDVVEDVLGVGVDNLSAKALDRFWAQHAHSFEVVSHPFSAVIIGHLDDVSHVVCAVLAVVVGAILNNVEGASVRANEGDDNQNQ